MKLYDIYNKYPISFTRGNGAYVYDKYDEEYVDFYSGHGVISIGHSHPYYIDAIAEQVAKLGFYSNAIHIPLQERLGEKLGDVSGFSDYELFLCNSGAEANENALKLASFHTGKTKIISLKSSFHGRTSAAVRATDNRTIQAPINQLYEVVHIAMNDVDALKNELEKGDVCAVILEGIQGMGGVHMCSEKMLLNASHFALKFGAIFIMDEVQCGYGRSGNFYSFQDTKIRPDIISMAKGMGNGFPIGGIAINPDTFSAQKGQLGSTFGGNHLACAAGIAVLDVIKEEKLMENAQEIGEVLRAELYSLLKEIGEVRGRGLMIGVEVDFDTSELRKEMWLRQKVLIGSSNDPNVFRLLPPLMIDTSHVDQLLTGLRNSLNKLGKVL